MPDAEHALASATVAERLGTDVAAGLTADEAASRLAAHGPNELDRGES
jgi:hypothetical protein